MNLYICDLPKTMKICPRCTALCNTTNTFCLWCQLVCNEWIWGLMVAIWSEVTNVSVAVQRATSSPWALGLTGYLSITLTSLMLNISAANTLTLTLSPCDFDWLMNLLDLWRLLKQLGIEWSMDSRRGIWRGHPRQLWEWYTRQYGSQQKTWWTWR